MTENESISYKDYEENHVYYAKQRGQKSLLMGKKKKEKKKCFYCVLFQCWS